ncbi:hypothetical protein YSY43_24200 [Paenibacillus sp. YSY-4.3]
MLRCFPKLTGTARYRGTKAIGLSTQFNKLGGTASRALLVPKDEGALCVFCKLTPK